MTNLIVELSKYALVLLIALYTCLTFASFKVKKKKTADFMLAQMTFLMLALQFAAYLVLCLKLEEPDLLYYYGFQALFLLLTTLLFRMIYKNIHRTLLSNMCMLLNIGLIMLTRINYGKSVRQFQILVVSMILALCMPAVIRKWKTFRDCELFCGITGILLLGAVLVLSHTTYGANLSFTVAGITVQPSEFVKILFVFCGRKI